MVMRDARVEPKSSERADSSRLVTASLVAVGIVSGDIGVNPLYVVRECFRWNELAHDRQSVLGVISLIFWALVVLATGKYVLYLRRAQWRGEGGVAVLTESALERERRPIARKLLLTLGLGGAALFAAQSVIGPAISVLNAMEGLARAVPAASDRVLPLSVVVLCGLFGIQRKGTRFVGLLFAPIMLAWFAALAAFGAHAIASEPSILGAINPAHAFGVLRRGGLEQPGLLSAVFLSVTGAEAFYAAMGHSGWRSVRFMWFALVGPALVLSYLGQGALILADPRAVQDPMLWLTPVWSRAPMLALSTAASVIAGQGVIAGAFSLARQANMLGVWDRLELRKPNPEHEGQVYAPLVNRVLALAAIGVTLGFGSSGTLVPTYIALVSASMTIATLLAYPASLAWGWSRARAALVTSLLLSCDLAFLVANVGRPGSAAWLWVIVAAVAIFGVATWKQDSLDAGTSGCLDEETVAALIDGALDGEALGAVEKHLAGCGTCANVVAVAAAASRMADSRPTTPTNAGATLDSHPVGQRSARYRRDELIGKGGMGEVYAGYDLQTDTPVAIKRLRPELAAASEETVDRFAREAAILRRLDHPNIVKMLAFERGDDHHDIVMELVTGGSLRDLLRSEGRLPVPRVLRMMLELSDALSRAHHLGVIHRDIKPENVLLAVDGTPRLADFGLARMGEESMGSVNGVLGTIAYLSPEALWGRRLDERADIWGLGVTLFEMLGGRRPFEGESHGAVTTAILHQPTPDVRTLGVAASATLVELIFRMLDKEPSRRPASARQVGAELEVILQARALTRTECD